MGCTKLIVLVVVVVTVATLVVVEGQNTPACAAQLVPCAAYLNSTKPPDSCCTPLKQAVEKDKDCLCNLYNTPGLLKSLGINITQALELPKNCGITADISACTKASAPTSVPPPGTPGGDSGAGKMEWTGMSFLLLFWAFMMVYQETCTFL